LSEIILHHYEMSPYAEKLRLAFGFKGLAWRSVQIPVVMPKPNLMELTGGYRRTPVLQIGADVYCDTKVCARVLDRLHPEPRLVPIGQETLVAALSRWAETSFMMAATIGIATGAFDADFVADREAMMAGVDFSRAPLVLEAKRLQLRANLALLERQLGDGRRFLLGDTPTLADLSAYHPVFFLRNLKVDLTEPRRLAVWADRVAAIGHGSRSELSDREAIDVARNATPCDRDPDVPVLPDGFAAGDLVAVLPEEIGSGVVVGELVPTGLHEIAVRRRSEAAGEIAVHFPREDYLVLRAGPRPLVG